MEIKLEKEMAIHCPGDPGIRMKAVIGKPSY
jgi:hypothetical protein